MSRKETVQEETVEVAASTDAKAFAKLVAAYREQNPDKYEAKKEAFEAKLASL